MHKVVIKDGSRMAVVRPADPAKALRAAEALVGSEDKAAFNQILREQEYDFVGLLGADRQLLDPTDTTLVVGQLQPGDSFVALDELLKAQPTLLQDYARAKAQR